MLESSNLEDLFSQKDLCGKFLAYRIRNCVYPPAFLFNFNNELLLNWSTTGKPITDMQMKKKIIAEYGLNYAVGPGLDFLDPLLTLWVCFKEWQKPNKNERHVFDGCAYVRHSEGNLLCPSTKAINILCCPHCGSRNILMADFAILKFHHFLSSQSLIKHSIWDIGADIPIRDCQCIFELEAYNVIDFQYPEAPEALVMKIIARIRDTENYLNDLRDELREFIKRPETQQFLNEVKRLEAKRSSCHYNFEGIFKFNSSDWRLPSEIDEMMEIGNKIEQLKKDFLAN